jgi:hypothetical protein
VPDWMPYIPVYHNKILQRINEYITDVPGFMTNFKSAFILVRLQEYMTETRNQYI